MKNEAYDVTKNSFHRLCRFLAKAGFCNPRSMKAEDGFRNQFTNLIL